MLYDELSNILFVFPYFIEISKNKIFNNTFNNVSGITYNMGSITWNFSGMILL
jgi:hypothetical protein